MNSSNQLPKVPLWVFFVTDLALIATAAFIASQSSQPLSPPAMLSIVACVIAGAVVALVPLVIRLERQKNEQLDERQRELEALARTVGASAEQISIAAGSLHEIAELAQRNLRQAEQLPHKLQEKIAEFQAQLANATDAEKEELENELAALRSSETERLETVADKLARATVELSKLESATHQQLATTTEAVAKLSLGTASAISKAQAAAEQALTQARVEATRQLGQAAGEHTRGLHQAGKEAMAALEARLADAGTKLAERMVRELSTSIAPALAAVQEKLASLQQPSPASIASTPEPASKLPDASLLEAGSGNGGSDPALQATRRIRKPRREEGTSADADSGPVAAAGHPNLAPLEPITPPGNGAAAPAANELSPTTEAGKATTAAPDPLAMHSPSAAPPLERRRPGKKPPAAAAEPEISLGMDYSSGAETTGSERVLSSDGATRVIVTAYIGIGNRLFIRGDGPGLTWEKGVPLQFVSIGKWRWETNEASGPIRYRIFKNDEQECAALGTLSLEPAHQQEVTASFA